jgi:hypothetical protein
VEHPFYINFDGEHGVIRDLQGHLSAIATHLPDNVKEQDQKAFLEFLRSHKYLLVLDSLKAFENISATAWSSSNIATKLSSIEIEQW